ncbi:polyprenyl synthetase family protein [Methylophilaceae bacterium]|nr:polyprenyl synthetase family protein [Methylophilaceae bacterium]
MPLENIISPIQTDLESVNNVIRKSLSSDIPIINQISHHIISSGGKRMRPILHLLISGMNGEINEINHKIAAIIEFIHTATLLHDDVVDKSEKRRNIKTANALFGNAASVLVGDFIYSRSFQMMVDIDNMKIMKILSDTTNSISEGEVLQLLNNHNPDISEDQYFKVIQFKTAKLFEACGSLAGISNENSPEIIDSYSKIGLHFGIIFQLIDDILDYSGDSSQIGKNLGDDLNEGKVTLPLIYAMHDSNEQQCKIIKDAIKIGDISRLPDIIEIIEETKSISKVQIKSEDHFKKIKLILDKIPDNDFKRIILNLAEYSVYRQN